MRRRRRTKALLIPALLLLVAGLCTGGCSERDEGPDAVDPPRATRAQTARVAVPRRAIEPRPGPSTADLPRAQIAGETRTVLGTRPRLLLRWQDALALDVRRGAIEVDGELPGELPLGAPMLLSARISVEDRDSEPGDASEPGAAPPRRRVLRSQPEVVMAPASRRVSVDVPVEDAAALGGGEGLADLIARPLGDASEQRWTIGPFAVEEGDRLVFGYAVEEDGWAPGLPAVAFEVQALPADDAAARPIVLMRRTLDPASEASDRGWFDMGLDLSTLAGRNFRFVFSASALGPIGESTLRRSFPVISNPELVAGAPDLRPPSMGQRPSVILISLDTLRARSMSAYGRERSTTPVFDTRVAGQGALVRRAVTPFPYTPPSHVSMLTGLDVCAHGIVNRNGILAPDRITLAEALRAAGYRTAAFTEDGYVVAGAGFARGFDTYHELHSDEQAAPGFAAETFARAEVWLRGVDGRPFFLFIHTYQVHGPYTPPEGYQGLFARDGLAGVPEAHRQALDDYEREVRYTDDLLGRLLDVLDELLLADRTVVVVTSDHGEQFGEHFFTGHGFDLHDEALLVPMAIRAPGLIAPGRVVDAQVGLMDLSPTLLDLLGQPALPGVQGRSFASLLLDSGARTLPVFEERALIGQALDSRSVRTGEYKYIEGGGEQRWSKLYHLQDDPGEQSDLSAGHAAEVERAREALAKHDAACARWRAAHPAPTSAADGLHERPGWMIHRDEIERRLRSLGYVE